ncbi:carboxylesterase [Pistricoccus aurantiacus]|uniref:Carboxylesterase n=1 Tax=Pistricoccus aurantiacus TaxID=1883414 RepID=A0A5B8STQ6_9GAMM|nr:carboxylesterase [Pistricoccus aurantiacus]QEA39307.1 carboxylesterase [Pistricoccus aurantiacus]
MSTSTELVIEPRGGKAADACVILLHGLGATGHDFELFVPTLNLPGDSAVRFILPHATRQPVTINGGMRMPAWYDILDMDLGRKIDEQQLRISAQRIKGYIDAQIDIGIDSRRIILAGFSQGGAVAYHTALTYPKPLGGLLALSTYFATADSIEPSRANRDIVIEVHHGDFDPVVPERLGRAGVERVRAMGYTVNYRRYPMQHALCPAQVNDISRWLSERLKKG